MNDAKRQQLITALKQVKQVFDAEGLVFWLDYGALLGAVREGGLLPWDHDVDLGVWLSDERKLFRCLEKLQKRLSFRTSCHYLHSGKIELFFDAQEREPVIEIALWHKVYPFCYNFVDDFSSHNKLLSPMLLYQHYLTLNVDYPIHRFKKQASLFKGTICKLPSKLKLLNLKFLSRIPLGYKNIVFFTPASHLSSFDKIDFHGETFSIPHRSEDYLAYLYGSSWRVPLPNWDTFRDQKSLFTRTPERGSYLYTKI